MLQGVVHVAGNTGLPPHNSRARGRGSRTLSLRVPRASGGSGSTGARGGGRAKLLSISGGRGGIVAEDAAASRGRGGYMAEDAAGCQAHGRSRTAGGSGSRSSAGAAEAVGADNFNVDDQEYVDEDGENEGFFQGSQVTLLDLAIPVYVLHTDMNGSRNY